MRRHGIRVPADLEGVFEELRRNRYARVSTPSRLREIGNPELRKIALTFHNPRLGESLLLKNGDFEILRGKKHLYLIPCR